MVPCSWLVTWVVYSIVAFAVSCLLFVKKLIADELITAMVFTACYNSLFHVFVMGVLILRRIQGNDNNAQTRQVPPTSLHASAQTVVFSAQLTCCEELFFATIGRIIQLVDRCIWILSMIGIDLSPFFFPMPFFKFYHARLFTSHYRIQGARIYLNAGFSDAYFLYLQERMLNFLTFTVYTRCKGETYPKWLDSKLQWVGAPPHGYNNHFRVFFNTGTLCERIDYYVESTILITFFGWMPFFRSIYLWWHYQQMVKRLVIGGSKATLDDGYSLCSFFGAYLGSCCGCCGHKILVFVDSHLHLRPAGIVAEEGEREMGALFGLTDRPTNSGMGSQSHAIATANQTIALQETQYVPEQSHMLPPVRTPPGEAYTGKYVRFNRGPRGNVGIQCEKFGLGAKIIGLIPDEPASYCGELAVGDVIESVDDMSLASMSLVEMRGLLKGQPGSMINLYIHSRGASNADRIKSMPQAAAGSVALPPAPSLNISSPSGRRVLKVPLNITFDKTRPSPMHMKTRETHRQVLLGLYFQRLSDPEWMNEVLAEYDLSNDTDDLISNGIKKGSDLGILMHEPSLLKDLSMTLIAKAKLRMLLNDLSETCNAHPEKDATMAATLDDVPGMASVSDI